jgi:hypothetical protein
MIQRRIRGNGLYDTFLDLDHKAKFMIVRELGQVFRALQRVRSQAAGLQALGMLKGI